MRGIDGFDGDDEGGMTPAEYEAELDRIWTDSIRSGWTCGYDHAVRLAKPAIAFVCALAFAVGLAWGRGASDSFPIVFATACAMTVWWGVMVVNTWRKP